MLQLRRAVWAVGGRVASSCSVVPSGTHEVVQVKGKLGRSSKQQCRECDLAAAFYNEVKRACEARFRYSLSKNCRENVVVYGN